MAEGQTGAVLPARTARQRQLLDREGSRIGGCAVAFAILLATLPMAMLVLTALAPQGAFAPGRALEIMSGRAALAATWNTVEVGFCSAVLAVMLGASFALALALTDVRGKRALALLLVLALLIAPQVIALAFKMLAGPASPLLQSLGMAPPPGTPNPMLGRGGIIAVLALHHAPLVAIILAAGLRTIPHHIVEAALIDGARPIDLLRRIVLPMLVPHLAAAAMLAFVAGAANFGIPALLGTPAGYLTLPTLIYRRIASFGPSVLADAAALAMLVGVIALLGVVAGARLLISSATRLEPGQAMRPVIHLGRLRLLTEVALWAVIAIVCLLPLVSLVTTSLIASYGIPLSWATATLANFEEVLLRQALTVRAFRNSFMYAAIAAVATAVIAFAVAYALDRRFAHWRAAVVSIIEIPYAIPGIVLAVAMILLFLRPLPIVGVNIYATPLIIIVAYLARFLAVALKAPLAAMATLSRDQEEAAACDGARLFDRIRHVIVPHLLPATTASTVLVFLMAFNELTVSALLWSAGTETLGVALLSLEEAGLVTEAAALATAATAVVAALVLALDRLAPQLPDGALPWVTLSAVDRGRR